MKKLLLSIASAALMAAPAFAQQINVLPLAQGNNLVTSVAEVNPNLTYGNKIMNTVPMLQKRQSRVAEDVRPHKLLSYVTNLDQLGQMGLGPLPITYSQLVSQGFNGYGFGQLYLQDMLSRYAGNTITSIEFCTSMGFHTNGEVFILDGGTGEKVWSAPTGVIESMYPSENGQGFQVPSNQVECDYVITGDEAGLYIGWVADYAPDPNFPIADLKDNLIMPMHTDGTGMGLGASLFIRNSQGQLGVVGDFAGWQDGSGNVTANCSYIAIMTDGENGLKDNDAQVGTVATIRVEKKSGVGSSAKVSLVNLGLDPIDSFDYVFESNGATKEGTCVLEDPLGFYNVTSVNLKAAYPDAAGRTEGTFVITKVNEVDDENVDNEDNEATYEALVFDKGFRRMPVVETFTSSQCAWCPIVGPALKKIEKQTDGNFIPLNVHIDMSKEALDPLKANKNYIAIHESYRPAGGAVPASMVNREVSGNPYAAAPVAVGNIRQAVCEANMKVTAGKLPNPMVKKIKVSTDLNFTFDVQAGAYALAYVVTEDGVTGVQQINNYAAMFFQTQAQNPGISDEVLFQAMTEELGYDFVNDENLRNMCKMGKPTAGGAYVYTPVYTDVACSITDVKDGAFTLPAIGNGESYTHQVELDAPVRTSPKVNRNNLSVTVLLIDKKSGTIVTATRAKLGETSVESGLEAIENNSNVQIDAANGAFQVVAENAVAEVYTVDGKLVSSATVQGSASLPTFGKGAYVIRVTEGKNVTSKKAVF